MGYIYLITNTVNKQQYVGQTLCNNVEKRWNQHKKCNEKTIGRYLLAAYKKYGIQSFKFQIICICFDEDCNIYEEEYIKKFNTLVPNGYNLQTGGKNSKQHPETIQKISDKLKGRRLTPMTDKIRKKLSENSKGENNSNYGKIISKEQKEKLSIGMKKIWEDRKKNNIHIVKLTHSNSTTLFKGENKRVVGKYDDNGNLLDKYTSVVEAGKPLGISHTTIGKVCRGVKYYKKAGGFVWKFLSDQEMAS